MNRLFNCNTFSIKPRFLSGIIQIDNLTSSFDTFKLSLSAIAAFNLRQVTNGSFRKLESTNSKIFVNFGFSLFGCNVNIDASVETLCWSKCMFTTSTRHGLYSHHSFSKNAIYSKEIVVIKCVRKCVKYGYIYSCI